MCHLGARGRPRGWGAVGIDKVVLVDLWGAFHLGARGRPRGGGEVGTGGLSGRRDKLIYPYRRGAWRYAGRGERRPAGIESDGRG